MLQIVTTLAGSVNFSSISSTKPPKPPKPPNPLSKAKPLAVSQPHHGTTSRPVRTASGEPSGETSGETSGTPVLLTDFFLWKQLVTVYVGIYCDEVCTGCHGLSPWCFRFIRPAISSLSEATIRACRACRARTCRNMSENVDM